MSNPKVKVGMMVNYVLGQSDHGLRSERLGEVRPAMVVSLCGTGEAVNGAGLVNLQVFVDGTNDVKYVEGKAPEGLLWATSAQYQSLEDGKDLVQHSWHFAA